MKVLFDHQTFTGAAYGGIPRYFYELMNVFVKRSDIEFELSLKFSNSEYLRHASYIEPIRYEQFAQNLRVNQLVSQLNRAYSALRLCSSRYDIFHPTFYHPYFLRYIGRKPLVLTFHDALSEKYGERFPVFGANLTEAKRKLLQRADAIISVSEASKRDILTYFDIHPDKIKVIHLGNYLFESVPKEGQKIALPARYVLFVGKRDNYKNFEQFWKAMTPILQADKDLRLVCAGGGSFTKEECDWFQKAYLAERVVHQPILDDGTLVQLYAGAQVFVFPSLMEGFGLPILEAMSSGCPVAATAGTSFDEIALDAAVYFEAEQTESIKTAIESVIYDSARQATLRERGRARLPFFSSAKTAAQTLDVYKALVTA
jgi:glycosyltransferase involved in cell wall biosynthesis